MENERVESGKKGDKVVKSASGDGTLKIKSWTICIGLTETREHTAGTALQTYNADLQLNVTGVTGNN